MALTTPRIPAIRPEALKIAADTLSGGGIIAYPTETFYGLGARFDDKAALERLYTIKERPHDKTFPLIIGHPAQLGLLTRRVHRLARLLAGLYWPGPLTLLLEAAKGLPPHIVHEGKIAVRIPGKSFALALARLSPFPVTATSANVSGMPPAADASSVAHYFRSELDLIVDGGRTEGALPSTIADVTGGDIRIVRRGAAGVVSLAKSRIS